MGAGGLGRWGRAVSLPRPAPALVSGLQTGRCAVNALTTNLRVVTSSPALPPPLRPRRAAGGAALGARVRARVWRPHGQRDGHGQAARVPAQRDQEVLWRGPEHGGALFSVALSLRWALQEGSGEASAACRSTLAQDARASACSARPLMPQRPVLRATPIFPPPGTGRDRGAPAGAEQLHGAIYAAAELSLALCCAWERLEPPA